jgi:hypothetical protein
VALVLCERCRPPSLAFNFSFPSSGPWALSRSPTRSLSPSFPSLTPSCFSFRLWYLSWLPRDCRLCSARRCLLQLVSSHLPPPPALPPSLPPSLPLTTSMIRAPRMDAPRRTRRRPLASHGRGDGDASVMDRGNDRNNCHKPRSPRAFSAVVGILLYMVGTHAFLSPASPSLRTVGVNRGKARCVGRRRNDGREVFEASSLSTRGMRRAYTRAQPPTLPRTIIHTAPCLRPSVVKASW